MRENRRATISPPETRLRAKRTSPDASLVDAGQVLALNVLDHISVGDGSYSSFLERENFGNLYLDGGARRGTFYLDAMVEQLQALLATAQDGRVKRRISVFVGKAKAAPAAAAARWMARGEGETPLLVPNERRADQ